MSAAAKALHLTHGAVSHQIRAIEGMLGQTLLVRQGRGVALTDAGRRYAYQVRPLLDELAQASTQVRASQTHSSLVLSVLPSWAMHWLLPRLSDWTHQQPHLHLSLRAGLLFTDLDSTRIDAAVRFGHGQWPNVQVQHLMGDALVVVAAPRLWPPTQKGQRKDWHQLPCMHAGESWAHWMGVAGLEGDVTSASLHFTDSTHLLEAARLGHGVALTRRSIAHSLLAQGELVLVSPVQAPHPDAYHIVWPHSAKVNPALRLFRDWLSVQVKQYEKELAQGDAQHSHARQPKRGRRQPPQASD